MHKNLSLKELRQDWSEAWSKEPHVRIGRIMLEKSLACKTNINILPKHQERLDQLTKQYKHNPRCFDDGCVALKPGMRLIREWKGKRHSVLVKTSGFEYKNQHFTSLTQIANNITGSRWNGHVFFGLRKKMAP